MIQKCLFKMLLSKIERASDAEISEIIQAVVRRYSNVFPAWEVMFLSLPKEPAQRRKQLEAMLEILKSGGML